MRVDAAIGCFAAVLSIFVTSVHYGGVNALGNGALSMVDSASYDAVGTAIWEWEKPSRSSIGLRGYLYPAFGTALLGISPWLLTVVQAVATGIGIAALVGTERLLAGRVIVTPLALLSFSLILAPGHLMSEAMAFCIGALALRLFVGRVPVWGLFALVLAALIKPAFWAAVPIAALLVVRINRSSLFVLLFSFAALTPQLWLSGALDGQVALTKSGSLNFERRFFPAVYGFEEHDDFLRENDPRSEAARALHPSTSEKIGYLIRHPDTAVGTWASILWEHHLLEPTGFSRRDNATALEEPRRWIEAQSIGLNLVFTLLLLPAALGAAMALVNGPNGRRAAVLLPGALIGTAPLVYFQGDRVVYIGLILALPFAGYALARLAARIRSGRWVRSEPHQP